MNIPTAPSLRRLPRIATTSLVLTCLLAASANAEEGGRLRGRLWVTPVEFVEDCSETAFARGDTVMLTGAGLAPGEAVVISFMQNDAENPIGSAKANGQGALSTRIPVPADAATGKDARFRATAERGSEGAGVVLTSAELQIFEPGDADSDGVKDMCDTCPALASDDQFDEDGDGQGDACDKCPSDPENDVDADGVCGDVDTD